MNMPEINLDQLAARLEPVIASIRKDGGAFAEIFGSELTKKASGGLVNLAYTAARSLGSAAWGVIKSSRAHRRFLKRWEAASSSREREHAVRQLLAEDPRVAKSLHSLLTKRDFTRAALEHAEHLPKIALIDTSIRLSEVYVPLHLGPISTTGAITSVGDVAPPITQQSGINILTSGNHLIEAPPGSGKSSLARWLVISQARQLLESDQTWSFDQVRIPVLVTARSLCQAQSDFASSLHYAVTADHAFSSLGPLPEQFFVPYSETGHKFWLIIIDGLDEIDDRHERQRLWDSVSQLHSQVGDAYRFVVTTRPEAIRVRSDDSGFQRWFVRPLTSSERRAVAYRYIENKEQADNFIAHMQSSPFSDIYAIPLFEAIAASIFVVSGRLPETKLGLCEAFTSALLEKSSIPSSHRDATLRLLTHFAGCPDPDWSVAIPEVSDLVPPDMPRLGIGKHLESLLVRSGLVQARGGQLSFIHDILRSYFLSLKLAKACEPSALIWRSVDPFTYGWTAVQYLCEAWAQDGKDVSKCVDALFAFGDAGEMCAAEVAISCMKVSDGVVEKLVERLIREAFSTGPTTRGVETLTRLARNRSSVRDRLSGLVFSDRDFSGSRLAFAECLFDSGDVQAGSKALLAIAQGQHEYHADRTRAAELLLKCGHKDIAYGVLSEVAHDGDELWGRADAASILFENARTDEHRELLISVLEQPGDEMDQVGEHTIARLLSLGEKVIALPLIRDRARPPEHPGPLANIPRNQIEAAKALANHHDNGEGVAALKALLGWPHVSLRGKAEVLEALGSVGAGEEARELLRQLVDDIRTYEGVDWFLLEMLIRYGLEEETQAVGLHLVNLGLDGRLSSSSLPEIIDRLLPHCDRNQIATLIRTALRSKQTAELAACLARLGFRDEGVRCLKSLIRSSDLELRIDAAAALCTVGERQTGVRALKTIVRNHSISVKARTDAAQALERVGEHDAADQAYLHLLRDPALPIKERCHAARHFDEDGINDPKVIWNVLFPYVQDDSNSIGDRVTAARELLSTVQPLWAEIDHVDVTDELLCMLEPEAPAVEAWEVVGALASTGLSFGQIPRAASMADGQLIPVEARIRVLQEFWSTSRDPDAADKLIEIAEAPETSYPHVINALQFVGERARTLLDELSRDAGVPPKWRLEAVGKNPFRRSTDHEIDRIIHIINDDGAAIKVRLDAFARVSSRLTTDRRASLLGGIACAPDLGTWERISIAETAVKEQSLEVAELVLHSALLDTPLSIPEMAEIAGIYHSLGDNRRAAALLNELACLPHRLLQENEDHYHTVEAAKLLAELGEPAEATHLLLRVLDLASWDDVRTILEAISEIAGSDEERKAANTVLPHLIAAPADPSSGYMGPWRNVFEYFLAREWTDDLSALLLVVEDTKRLSIDRAEAAKTIYLNSWRDKSRDWAAIVRRSLSAIVEEISSMECAELIPILRICGLRDLAEQKAYALGNLSAQTPRERPAVAKILLDLGHRERAKEILCETAAIDDVKGFLGPGDERLIADLQGKEHLERITVMRAFDEGAPLVDRLLDARDLVSRFGSKQALELIFSTARAADADPNDRLQAIEVLEELGFRELPRRILPELLSHPELDDYWAGDVLLRYGRKAEALARIQRAVTTCPKDYRDQIARRLAELQAIDVLDELDQVTGEAAP